MKKETIIGLLFFAGLGLAFFLTIFSQSRKTQEYPFRTKLYYSRIDGLQEGTQVYIKGIEAGYVLSIDVVDRSIVLDDRNLEENRKKVIELTLALRKPLTLWDNYRVRFKTKTVFSDRIIDIDPGFYPGDDTVYYEPYYEPDKETANFFPSAQYIDNFFEAANGVIRENQEDVRSIVINSRETSEKLLGTQGSLPRLINTMEAYDELDRTIALIGITAREARRYQEGYRKMEQTHPIPFLISSSFFGGTTLTGRELEPISSFRNLRP